MSMVSVVLAVVVVLALVYFFRPQMFNFLKQGFSNSRDDLEGEGFDDDLEGFDGCPEGKKDDGEGGCVTITEGFFGCVEGVDDETGEPCS